RRTESPGRVTPTVPPGVRMSTTPGATNAEQPSMRKQLQRVVAASMAGTVVEWYEFFLYASAATLVFNHILFPPSDNPFDAVIAAFGTYAVGFIARPVGGIVFGHFGDKYGRKALLQFPIKIGRASCRERG